MMVTGCVDAVHCNDADDDNDDGGGDELCRC